jgi:hypothetical protein
MREIKDHIVEGDLPQNQLKIVVLDEPGEGGANHRYKIGGAGFRLEDNPSFFENDYDLSFDDVLILFQNGPIKEAGLNGITQEALLAIVIDRLRSFQAGPFPHRFLQNSARSAEMEDRRPACPGRGRRNETMTKKKVKEEATLSGLTASFGPEVETIKITQMLPVPLTPAGQWEVTQALARALKKIDQLQDGLKSVKSEYKSQIDKQQEIVNELTTKINSGNDDRMVECELIKDYTHNTVTIRRLDTGEKVSTRTMEAFERQRGLDLAGQAAEEAAGQAPGQGENPMFTASEGSGPGPGHEEEGDATQ